MSAELLQEWIAKAEQDWEAALRLKEHNADKFADVIAEAASTIDIRVIDHIIVGKDDYFSFIEKHLLPGISHTATR